MEAVAARETPNVNLIGIGGTLRPLTRSYVGPYAVHTVLGHFADKMFLSVKGVTRDGVMTDADELEAEVKRAMIAQSEESVLLLDDSKLGARGQNAIARVTEVSSVLAHGAPGRRAGTAAGDRREAASRRRLARVRRRHAPVDVEDVAGLLARTALGREVQHGLGDVAGVDADLQRVALAVVLVELLRVEVVGRGALLAPATSPRSSSPAGRRPG